MLGVGLEILVNWWSLSFGDLILTARGLGDFFSVL